MCKRNLNYFVQSWEIFTVDAIPRAVKMPHEHHVSYSTLNKIFSLSFLRSMPDNFEIKLNVFLLKQLITRNRSVRLVGRSFMRSFYISLSICKTDSRLRHPHVLQLDERMEFNSNGISLELRSKFGMMKLVFTVCVAFPQPSEWLVLRARDEKNNEEDGTFA